MVFFTIIHTVRQVALHVKFAMIGLVKISFNQTTSPNVRDDNGYGYAAKMCKDSLNRLGHEVTWRDETADIEINFIQPGKWYWTGPYRIGYLPWESTKFHDGWVDDMNECDEVWTPSPVVAGWMADAGVKRDIHVYQHGVDDIWTPVKRNDTGRFRMLHHGAEALRKDSASAINALYQTFTDDEDAELWLKCQLDIQNFHDTDRLKIRNGRMHIDSLVELYHESHLLVYPSWGEGFGLAPVQAMATGMPVLITKGWAPYEHYLPENCLIESELADSPWPHHHPGQMFKPDFEDLKDKLRWQFENRDKMTDVAFSLADSVKRDYQWDDLTRKAFAHLLG